MIKITVVHEVAFCVWVPIKGFSAHAAVLAQNGYEAGCGLSSGAEETLRSERFDLILVSPFLVDQDKEKLLAIG
jgi:hypothetical protein